MMKKTLLKYISSLLLILPILAHAVWFQGEGSAEINDGEVDQARHKAVQNALLGLMYKGGASIRSVQVVKSGVLESDKLTVRTNGEVHDLQVMREHLTHDRITVTVRADIFPMRTCNRDNYSKTMLVGPITIQKREQAQLGGIYDLGSTLSEQIYQQLQISNRRIDARHLMMTPIASLSDRRHQNQMLQVARSLSSQNDVQYILFGHINDLSNYTTTQTSQLTGVDDITHHRGFKISLYVIDGIKGQIVFQKSYSTNQKWSFDPTRKVDVEGDVFWRSRYGKAINYILQNAIQDIQVGLYCQQTLADVVGIDDNQLVINLGQANGVQVGDTFKLMRTRYLISQDGAVSSPVFNNTESPEFKVVSIQPDRAILQADRYSDMANIQVRDILISATQLRGHTEQMNY
ncbi:flagellar assembly protein T N-terminal domain-containing protein [Celerinatantimonas sp. YJH-8]|uniref:flagellar assembly protein T N-terminal domain-containing protein n=1 Tax=Celerinatantimonas sp. YJH-8 TaxID=3228714 RepID=UPI0038C4B85E